MRFAINHILSAILTSALIIGSSACGSSKGAASAQSRIENNLQKSLDEKFVDLADSYQSWSYVQMPVKISLKSPKNLSVSGRLTMVNNAYINISVRLLGIELAILYIDNDNLFIVDKLNHQYVETSLSVFERAAGLCLSDLQSLLLGQAFVPGKGTITLNEKNSFDFESLGDDHWSITPKKKIDGIDWNYTAFSPVSGSPIIESFIIHPVNYSPLSATFTGHTVTTAGNTAQTITVDGQMHQQEIKLSITLNPSKADWNNSSEVSGFKIPGGYQRVPVGDVVKMLKHL